MLVKSEKTVKWPYKQQKITILHYKNCTFVIAESIKKFTIMNIEMHYHEESYFSHKLDGFY